MIHKIFKYPWYDKEVEYTDYVYKVVKQDKKEEYKTTDTHYEKVTTDKDYQLALGKFTALKNRYKESKGFINYNSNCFRFIENGDKYTAYFSGTLNYEMFDKK